MEVRSSITAYNASMLFILLYHSCLWVNRLSAFHRGTCLIDRFARHAYTQNPACLTDNHQLQHILAAFSQFSCAVHQLPTAMEENRPHCPLLNDILHHIFAKVLVLGYLQSNFRFSQLPSFYRFRTKTWRRPNDSSKSHG